MKDPRIISPSEDVPTRLLTPSAALNEFRVALDVWFPNMDDETRKEAVQMAVNWRPPVKPRKKGAA